LEGWVEYLNKRKPLVALAFILLFSLSACDVLPFDIPWLADDLPTSTIAPGDTNELTPTPEITPAQGVTPEPVIGLTVWVPPEMDPALETAASQLFANRLEAFSDLHDGLEINVRVKAASGVGGLLDSLTATSGAAPDALPDLIVLSRPDLEIAALKGLIFSMDGLTDIPDDPDWYSFTRNMALLQGETFGLPFAADSLVFVYRTENISGFPASWSGLLDTNIPLAFPAESDQALFPLSLYLAAGGEIQDSQRRPMLSVDPLTEVFRLFQEGVESGIFSSGLSQYLTPGQVWSAYRDGQVDLVVTWVSNYLKENPGDTAISPLLPVSNGAVSIGTGLSWALVASEENRQPIAVELAEFLVGPEFLAEWTLAAGYLPPRPSALDAWKNPVLVSKISQIALMTRLYPTNDIISSLGPILRDGTRQVLQGMMDPAQAAQVAVENLEEQ